MSLAVCRSCPGEQAFMLAQALGRQPGLGPLSGDMRTGALHILRFARPLGLRRGAPSQATAVQPFLGLAALRPFQCQTAGRERVKRAGNTDLMEEPAIAA